MNVLEKIDKIRKEKNWSIYKLADEAGLTQSTVANMFSRKSMPSIYTLKQICDAFNISLSQFFNENEGINNDEEYIIYNYRKLKDENKKYIKQIIEIMLK